MYRHGAMMALIALMGAGGTGCYYDEWQASERSNRVLREDLARVQDDLQNAEYMNRQKDTTIDGLNKQLATRQQQVASLEAENQSLRTALTRAQDILQEHAHRGPGPITFFQSALPPALHEELKRLAEAHPDVIEYDAAKGAVRWKADLLFDLGSDQLAANTEAAEALRKFAAIVSSEAARGFDVIVVGHTCSTPIARPETLREHKTNWHLSAHRAISVMQRLAQERVAMTRIGVMGYGEHRPIADNASNDGKMRNRRVEIFLVPRESVQAVSGGVYEVGDSALVFVRPNDEPGS